jgi:hypothetical protein
VYYTHIENGANGASNANQLDMPSLEPPVSRVSIPVTVGRQRNSNIVDGFGTVGNSASALDFTTIAGLFIPLAGIRWEDAGRSHWMKSLSLSTIDNFTAFAAYINGRAGNSIVYLDAIARQ